MLVQPDYSMAVAPLPDVPTEQPLVKISRRRNVRRGYLKVADLAVGKRRRHSCSLRSAILTGEHTHGNASFAIRTLGAQQSMILDYCEPEMI